MATVQDYLQNPQWVHRLGQIFETLDTNKNGFLSSEDSQLAANNLEKEVKPAAHLMAAPRSMIDGYYAALVLFPASR